MKTALLFAAGVIVMGYSLLQGGADSKPHEFAIHPISSHYISPLRTLNRILLPVNYSDHLYSEILSFPDYCRVVVYRNSVVGAIASRLVPATQTEYGDLLGESGCGVVEYHLYIVTLGVLANFRKMGLGTRLLDALVETARNSNARELEKSSPSFVISYVTLHVQSSNAAAIEFYKKNGFTSVKLIEKYYSNLEPRSAYLFAKSIF